MVELVDLHTRSVADAGTSQALDDDENVELEKSNVLLMGPTGSGMAFIIAYFFNFSCQMTCQHTLLDTLFNTLYNWSILKKIQPFFKVINLLGKAG